MKTYYNQAVTKWLKKNPGRVVTQFQVASLFSEAYGKTATISNALSGFLSTGINPLNPDIFPEHLFNPAAPTDRPQNYSECTNSPSMDPVQTIEIPSTSDVGLMESAYHVKPHEISPIPIATRSGERKRRHGGSQILTSARSLQHSRPKK